MRTSDVSITDASVDFDHVALAHPLMISGRAINGFTFTRVYLEAKRRDGASAEGQGTTIFSVPWSWPLSELSIAERDARMRELTLRLIAAVRGHEPMDPVQLWRRLYTDLDRSSAAPAGEEAMPRLAALLALGAVDSAVHDAWAKAAGTPAHLLYTSDHLSEDLSFVGSHQLVGAYPSDFLTEPKPRLPIQHLVGTGDPLYPEEAASGEPSLVDWLRADRPQFLKVKTSGASVADDAERIVRVRQAAASVGLDPALSVDPNEAYADTRQLAGLLDHLERRRVEISFIEQPFPRGIDAPGLADVRARVPILLDEGFTRIDDLQTLSERGWSGVVIKTAKGQTPALLAHSFARATGVAVTLQDLTTVDAALEHSARLASVFSLDSPHFECNSRQYAPSGNDVLARRRPGLVEVVDGFISVSEPQPGIY